MVDGDELLVSLEEEVNGNIITDYHVDKGDYSKKRARSMCPDAQWPDADGAGSVAVVLLATSEGLDVAKDIHGSRLTILGPGDILFWVD